MKISIIGYYGGNFGDLLMLDTLINLFKQKYDEINILTYGDHVLLRESITDYPETRLNIVSVKKDLDMKAVKKALDGSMALLWGGGTCFMDQGGTGGIKFMLLGFLKGVKIYYLGVGIDSVKKSTTKLCVRLAVLLSKGVYLRDNKSVSIAKKLTLGLKRNIHYIPDLAYANEGAYEGKKKGGYVVYSCRNLSDYQGLDNNFVNSSLVDLVIEAARKLNVSKVVNLVCDYEVDIADAEQANLIFASKGLEVETVYGNLIQKSMKCLHEADFIVTARLHPAVVAQTLAVPYAVYDYSDKINKFVEETGEKGRLILRHDIPAYKPLFTEPVNQFQRENGAMIKNVINELF
ncbi:polysaccharide pyruvyl transferase family protein [Mucilaginibacter aquaedulcis]|uniref:polysaccharide pyruvyl transferase family protein n=1 Tax=Mucilaginibacter aquaedulcis TaxID=1187081 RepID=UPI0025B5F5A2|nr:polysaccharide pyruvyl transferase family protein [Mucilaginibacter aquaedulcis]MDN3549756.1 polysaccharide pyruvyl transferase family protein [Mucilaginibacter aquaedulcis]